MAEKEKEIYIKIKIDLYNSCSHFHKRATEDLKSSSSTANSFMGVETDGFATESVIFQGRQ